MFNGSVNNQSIPDVQKLCYLKGALKGNTAKLLSHHPAAEANYTIAMNLLKKRYQNLQMIVTAHLDHIYKITPTKMNAPETLRQPVGTFRENQIALSSTGLDMTN